MAAGVCLTCLRTKLNTISVQSRLKSRKMTSFCSSLAFYGTRKADDASQNSEVNIPTDRLTVTYSRSSGPGGQNVNKVNTKAEVRFHIYTADWIPEDIRQKAIEKNRSRINRAGELIVTSEASRSQHRNFADCVQKISAILAEAAVKPRVPTAEDVALKAARLEKSNRERLRQKKMNAAVKNSRRADFD